jgi:SAM-dependent methyltransferase
MLDPVIVQKPIQYAKYPERKVYYMWRVQLYVFIHRHPKIQNWLSRSYLSRMLMPFLFNFDHKYSDRRYMSEEIIPVLAASNVRRLLFVGCKEYTARYGKRLTRAGVDYWTTDIDPAAAIWGERDHHIVCDIAKIDQVCPAESFDAVLLNGVLGDGIDEESVMNRALTAIARILRPNGILLIGWNSEKKHPNPLELSGVTTNFRHGSTLSLPARKTFADTDHIYDWLIKANDAATDATARG